MLGEDAAAIVNPAPIDPDFQGWLPLCMTGAFSHSPCCLFFGVRLKMTMAKPAMDGRTVTVSHRAQRRSSSMQNAEAEAEPPQSQNF
jgi:hypothetical protein